MPVELAVAHTWQNSGLQCELMWLQALNLTEATEAMASDAPGLGLGAPLRCPHRHVNFLTQVPFQNRKCPFSSEKWPAPFRYKIQGLLLCSIHVRVHVCDSQVLVHVVLCHVRDKGVIISQDY